MYAPMTIRSLPAVLTAERLRQLALRLLGIVVAAFLGAGAAIAQSTEDPDAVDPPGRIGSVTLLAGPVTMVDLSTGSREEALMNWPVTGGWRIETGRGGRAEVRIGSTALRLDDDTTVDFPRLDDGLIQIAVLRGGVSLRLRSREVLGEIDVLTQRERMVFEDVGRYRIDVDRPAGVTAVTAFFGRVRIGINGSTFVVGTGQRGELAASPMLSFEITPAAADRFDDWVATRDAREDSIRSTAYVSRETTGVEMLDEYGDWRTVEQYGPVWFPRSVPATWAPYRYGRWVWVSPWGWTWVDEAPWGFAPLHYGRWVVVGGYWGWVPGVVVPWPVYAPALVAWFGTPGFSVTVGGPIGWFPLGPHEVYVPAYRHTPRYLRVVNVQHVPNVAAVTIVQTPRYVNRHPDRSTWVSDDRFGRPEPVQRDLRPPPSEWRRYIARAQPPANVPNTKRRQANEGVARPAPSTPALDTPAATPAAPAGTRPVVRPPSPVPGAVEAPRPAQTPRAVEAPRALPATPPARPEPARGAGEARAVGRDGRRVAPTTPSQPQPAMPATTPDTRTPRESAPRPPPTQPRQAPSTPTIERPRQRDVVPVPAWPTQRAPMPSAPTIEPPRQRDVAPVPAPSVQPPQPGPAAPSRPRETAPSSAPRSVDVPAPRSRGEGAAPRDGQWQAPRGPQMPPAAPSPSAAAPHAAPPSGVAQGSRDGGRAPARASPSTQPDSGDPRGGDRAGGGREAPR